MKGIRQATGKCFVCGRSTKLLIHGECGKKGEQQRVAETNVSPKARRRIYKSARKAYCEGRLPAFMYR